MPTYQYRCTACGHQLEAVQSFADAPLAECPTCQGKLRKLFSSVGIVFKGPGFYRTDSRAGDKNGEPAKSEKSEKVSASSGEGKSSSGESKPGSSGSSGESKSSSSGSSGEGKASSSGTTASKPAA